VARKRVPELLDLVVLTEAANRKLREFSKGMLQRIGLAQAMLNEPALIFLDEPTSGLDPIGRRLVRDIIRDLRARQTTIFLNSHLLSEVEITCDRVAFVKTGRVVRQATLAELAAGQTVVDLRVAGLTPETVNGLRNWTQDLTAQDGRLTLTLSDEEPLPAIASYLIGQGARLYEMTPRRTSLEDMFLEIMGPDSKPG
jgi:ABC-2 type transport system ATP-binding protein